jgi:flagellum-specific peptidoglycan hydrolase FlgJ
MFLNLPCANKQNNLFDMLASTAPFWQYLQRNWFKLALAALLVFIILKKDLSLRINLNTPLRMEQGPAQPSVPVDQKREGAMPERFTDNQQAPAVPKKELPSTERFELVPPASARRGASLAESLGQVDESVVQAYIQRFGRVAAAERKKFGIPAAIILANALLHSQAGHKAAAGPGANNHFALPCTPDWQGGSGQHEGRCYRYYENAWTSFRDHSLYLTTGRYAHFKQLSDQDYKAWARALEKEAFSTEKNLARQLVQTIEKYQLSAWDR